MDDAICAIFLASINVVAEIEEEKIHMHMWQKGLSSKKVLMILRREIF